MSSLEQTQNITPLSIDRRPAVIRILKRLTLFVLLFVVAFSAYIYRDELNTANLKRVVSYLRAFSLTEAEAVNELPLDSSMQNCYASLGSGLAVLNRDTLTYLNVAGGIDMEVQLGYARPAICAGDKLILTYDRGSTSLAVSNAYEVLKKIRLESPIITAFMNANGAFAVCTDENGYRAAVTVYDERQSGIYLWQTSEYFVSGVSLSDSGTKMAAAAFSGSGIDYTSKVILFSTTEKEPLCEIAFSEQTILGLHFLSERRILVVTDLQAAVYDIDGSLVGNYALASGSLKGFSFVDSGVCLALDAGRSGLRLVALSDNGEPISDTTIEGELQSISSKGDCTAVLTSEAACLYDKKLRPLTEVRETRGGSDILMRSDGAAFIVYSDHAELFGLA